MIDYYVALHNENWPTMQALQECIDRHGWPVKIGGARDPQWAVPLDRVPNTPGMPVVFNGESVELEASFMTVGSDQPYPYVLAFSINETLASIGATDVRFNKGDRILGLTFGSNPKEHQAGSYVLAALIKCFNGYGFNGPRHGASTYADLLLAEAVRLESDGTTSLQVDDMNRALDHIRSMKVVVKGRKGNDPKQ
jgi:hypothetical protein